MGIWYGWSRIVMKRAEEPEREAVVRDAPSWWMRLLVGRKPVVTFLRMAVLVVASVMVFKLVLLPVRITGRSMEPAYRDGRINFIHQLAYRNREPRRGDVVGIQFEGSRLIHMKRVVALPGERVAVRDGRVLVDGVPLEEPYARGQEVPSMQTEIQLDEDEYFVIGDNRDDSEYGRVRRDEIRGRVLF